MTAVLQVSDNQRIIPTADQVLNQLMYAIARELGLGKRQAEQAANARSLRLDGIQVSVSCLETDLHRDAIIVAKLPLTLDPDSTRQLLEINLIAAIALHATIAIDSDGDAILLAMLPIEVTGAAGFAKHISQMVLFATTVQQLVGFR